MSLQAARVLAPGSGSYAASGEAGGSYEPALQRQAYATLSSAYTPPTPSIGLLASASTGTRPLPEGRVFSSAAEYGLAEKAAERERAETALPADAALLPAYEVSAAGISAALPAAGGREGATDAGYRVATVPSSLSAYASPSYASQSYASPIYASSGCPSPGYGGAAASSSTRPRGTEVAAGGASASSYSNGLPASYSKEAGAPRYLDGSAAPPLAPKAYGEAAEYYREASRPRHRASVSMEPYGEGAEPHREAYREAYRESYKEPYQETHKEPVRESYKEAYSFPTTGSFVAEPYRDGTPLYTAGQPSYPSGYQERYSRDGRSCSPLSGRASPMPGGGEPQLSYGDARGGCGASGYSSNGYGSAGYGANGYSSTSYGTNGYSSSGYGTNGYSPSSYGTNSYGGYADAGYKNGYADGYTGGHVNGYNSVQPSDYGYGDPRSYMRGDTYTGGMLSYGPPPGRTPPAGGGSGSYPCGGGYPTPGYGGAPAATGASLGYGFPTTGSFLAEPPPAAAPRYGLPAAGSFVAEPFAPGAPQVPGFGGSSSSFVPPPLPLYGREGTGGLVGLGAPPPPLGAGGFGGLGGGGAASPFGPPPGSFVASPLDPGVSLAQALGPAAAAAGRCEAGRSEGGAAEAARPAAPVGAVEGARPERPPAPLRPPAKAKKERPSRSRGGCC